MNPLIYIKDAARHISPDGSIHRMCYYLCFCGKEFIAQKKNVVRGNTKSCGCHRSKRAGLINLTHGFTVGGKRMSELISWDNMMARCYNKACPQYNDYGGRGIKVCKRWHKFENFYTDMGKNQHRLIVLIDFLITMVFTRNQIAGGQQCVNKRLIEEITFG